MKPTFWNKVYRGSKITLKKDKQFNGINGKQTLKAGNYYITGFWANICGLNTKNPNGENEFIIPSIQLKKFENIL